MNLFRALALAGGVGALSGSASCAARSPEPCIASDRCGSGRACVSGRCVPIGSETAPPDGRRMLVAPSEMAVVSPASGDGALPSEILFGGVAGRSIVLLRFPTPWGNRVRVASAFLTLDPFADAVPSTQPVEVTVARVLEPWSADDVSWARLPRLSVREGRAFATTGPLRPLRIDVTSIVQSWTSGRTGEHGIALVSTSTERAPAAYSTGVSGGRTPRLDVYLR